MTPSEVEEIKKEYRESLIRSPANTEDVAGYDVNRTFLKGDVTRFNNSLYRLKTERARGIEPTNKTYWENISLADLIKEISKENEL